MTKQTLTSGVKATSLKDLHEETRPDTAAILANRTPARSEMKRMTMVVEPDFHRRLKLYAAANDMTMEDIYRAALREWLDRHEGGKL